MFKWYREFKAYRKHQLEIASAPKLHGVNMALWDYLGRSIITYTYADSTNTDNASVFFFCKKGNTDIRKFVIVPDYPSEYHISKFSTHAWITSMAEVWQAAERDLYDVIRDEPSKFLEDFMLKNHKNVWSSSKKWWVESNTAKYEAAKTKSKKKTENLSSEDNVVKVDFKKDENKE